MLSGRINVNRKPHSTVLVIRLEHDHAGDGAGVGIFAHSQDTGLQGAFEDSTEPPRRSVSDEQHAALFVRILALT
jgi:hypothetical protein